MSLTLPMTHELNVTWAQIEMNAWRSDTGAARDDVLLSLNVESSSLNQDDRKVTGQVILGSSPNREGASLFSGDWIFYTADRFHTEIEVPEALLIRIWNCYAARPDWLLLNFWEMPEILTVDQHYEGLFRIGCRAGSERSDRQARL